MDTGEIFAFLAQKAATGVATALVTVTEVTGSSMRNPGTHMAVSADGVWSGSLSGGCVEAAVVAEAMEALAVGTPRQVRFGTGSNYIDIRLPCGGSLDILINLVSDTTLGARALALLDAREPFVVRCSWGSGPVLLERRAPHWRTRRDADAFSVAHLPPLAIVIIGHGASVEALEAQASVARAVVRVLTPDRAIAERLESRGASVTRLKTPDDDVELHADPWTAVAFVFHDHDWESALVAQALTSPAFYVGAMGSRQAQAVRTAALLTAGVPTNDIERLRAPIGLIPSSRDPQVLALSILAEIVRDFDRATERADIVLAEAGSTIVAA